MWTGDTARRIRDLFHEAREAAERDGACLIFIDEIDAIASARSSDTPGINAVHEREHTAIVNQLLVLIDGFNPDEGVIVIGATNHPDKLDSALTRAGRFDRHITFNYPDQEGRMEILQIKTKNVKLAPDVRLQSIASALTGRSGADVALVVDEARRSAIKRDEPEVVITQADLSQALQRLLLGLESDISLSPKEAETVAIHEAGHTVMALEGGHVTVERVTIVPHGNTLGVTVTPPFAERHILTDNDFLSQIKMLLAGKLAEEVCLGQRSTTVANDLKKATQIATRMVLEFGMSTTPDTNNVRAYQVDYDNSLPAEVDEAIDHVLEKSRDETMATLNARRDLLKAIAERLMEKRTIEHTELMALVAQYPVQKQQNAA